MTFPDPATLLRHRPPAVLVREVVEFTGDRLVATSNGAGPWAWPALLEGGAQTAGLLIGAQQGGLSNRAVIADYRNVVIGAVTHQGAVRFTATIDRRIMAFWLCQIAVHDAGGALLLEGIVTLAPPVMMSRTPVEVVPLDPQAYALLAAEGFEDEPFNADQHTACELIERYAGELAADLCRREGLDALLTTGQTADELRRACGWGPQILPALSWLLARLTADGMLAHDGGAYWLARPLPAPRGPEVRQYGLEADPSYAPAYELLDEAARAFAAVARGETTGEQALLGKLGLWIRYFDNRNAYYALNNRVAARAVADRLGDAAQVLEVGAGLGSAGEALLDELAARGTLGRVAAYQVTEPVQLFRRRAERVLSGLHPALPLRFGVLDVNEPWEAQGIAPASQHLVWGVNVFHLAHDLDPVLAEAAGALAPGGWLIAGEGIRPAGDTVVGAEFPFRLLESFTSVRLDATRRTPGFLTAEEWQAAFARAGLTEVALVPDVVRLRAYYRGMLAAAVCGRKP